MQISKNTILITGGTSGIGFELARQLLAKQNTVIITGRDQDRLAKAAAQLPGVKTIQSDVSDPTAITALYEKVLREYPELNILINNAGIMRTLNLHESGPDLQSLTSEIETNLNGPIRMSKQFLPHLKTKSAAAIVNVSSGLAFVPFPISPVYCATKAGLHSFTQSLRIQLKNTAVQVFELAPPATKTPILAGFHSDDLKEAGIMKVDAMVQEAIAGMSNDLLEICPGRSKQLRMMNRIAPKFILGQLSRPVDRMLAGKS